MALPTFSVAIETANLSVADLDGLRGTLDALAAQTMPITRANEVLLTDSGDVPADVLEQLLRDFPWVQAVRLPRGTGYEELKRAAVDAATGEVIVFADGDCDYEPAWLEALLDAFQDPAAGYTIWRDPRARTRHAPPTGVDHAVGQEAGRRNPSQTVAPS